VAGHIGVEKKQDVSKVKVVLVLVLVLGFGLGLVQEHSSIHVGYPTSLPPHPVFLCIADGPSTTWPLRVSLPGWMR
jgi:hypothetical protein